MNREQRLTVAIAEAFDKQSLHIRYETKRGKTKRVITPLCFQTSRKNDKLLVLAYCWKREMLRSFFIHRIAGVDPVELRPVGTEMLCDLLLTGQTTRYARDFTPTAYALELATKESK